MQPQVERFLTSCEFGSHPRRRRPQEPHDGVMEDIRAALGRSSNVEILRSFEEAGDCGFAMLDLRNRWGPHAAP
eukprot:3941831-Lingulodinium_polyedra.AAC.1